MFFEILGLTNDSESSSSDGKLNDVMNLLLNLRTDAKKNKDFETSDQIRNALAGLGIEIKDKKDDSSDRGKKSKK